MKLKLSFVVFLFYLLGWSQPPVITGDLMLCPNDFGIAQVVGDLEYDSYQWYYKYWFVEGEFEVIEGASEDTFTYDWMTYDQALFKVVVTLGGETFESNIIQIDSYNWSSLVVMFDLGDNVTVDGETGDLLLCDGTSLELNVNMPYTHVEWYKDGELIEGETQMNYSLTQAGVYHVEAAPSMCPNSKSTSMPIIVNLVDCGLSVENPNNFTVKVYPTPVNDVLHIEYIYSMGIPVYTIFDHTGRIITTGQMTTTSEGISFEGLSSGIYLVNIKGKNYNSTYKILKK